MLLSVFLFFFNDTATTEIYTLYLHDALPISLHGGRGAQRGGGAGPRRRGGVGGVPVVLGQRRGHRGDRSEEHTSELQSRRDLVCRLLLEKKNKNTLSTDSQSSHSAKLGEHHP